MKIELVNRVLKEGVVDTARYRYISQGVNGAARQYRVIKRLPIDALDTTVALDGWETVWTESHIATLRAGAGLTQSQLAEQTGINIRQLQRLEAGGIKAANVTLANALKLAEALHCTPGELLEKEE